MSRENIEHDDNKTEDLANPPIHEPFDKEKMLRILKRVRMTFTGYDGYDTDIIGAEIRYLRNHGISLSKIRNSSPNQQSTA